MAPLHGRLLVPAVLRPFGEHLAAMVQPSPGDVCVDAGGEGAVMPALFARGAVRRCIAVSDDAETLDDARDELSMLHVDGAAVLRARGEALPLRDGCAQVVTSLFWLPHRRDPAAALRELLRILDPHRGRLAVAVWSEPDAVPHLAARGGDGGAHALGYPGAAAHLVEQAGGSGRVTVSHIHDVVRFDGLAHWWAAVAGETAGDPPPAAAAGILQPFTAPDGTMRIPCEAVVLTTEAP